MRIILSAVLPSNEELRLFAEMGIEVKNIGNQYYNRNYYVETDCELFARRDEMTGVANTTAKTTISYNGIDVMTTEKSILFGGGVSVFKLDTENAKMAIELLDRQTSVAHQSSLELQRKHGPRA